MGDFKNLLVWKKAHSMTLQIYNLTRMFPSDEKFGLTSQIRKAACSIPLNIAEGCGRGNDGDFSRFLDISMGSAMELEYGLFLAQDLSYGSKTVMQGIRIDLDEVQRMLNSLIQKVRKSRTKKKARS